MIERICRTLFFAVIIVPLFFGGIAHAQKTAEFELGLTMTDTAEHGDISIFNNRAIGYDTAATDSLDAAFGEMFYPGGAGPGVNDFYFTLPDTDQDVSIIDIRHKPAIDSFSLDYQMTISIEDNVGSIYWDPSQIPDAVTGIWIRPYYSSTPIMDMKNNRIFTFTSDSLITWGPYLVVTVFYNMAPHAPLSGVENAPPNGSGLIASASVYPNPMPGGGSLDLTLNEPAYVSITGCDVAGREVLRFARYISSGENAIDLSSIAGTHGAVFLRVDAESGTRSEVKSVVVMKE